MPRAGTGILISSATRSSALVRSTAHSAGAFIRWAGVVDCMAAIASTTAVIRGRGMVVLPIASMAGLLADSIAAASAEHPQGAGSMGAADSTAEEDTANG